MVRSRQHLCQQGEINLAVGVIELAEEPISSCPVGRG